MDVCNELTRVSSLLVRSGHGPSTLDEAPACIAACEERSVLASARSSLFKCFGPIKAMLGLSACAADTTRSSHRCRK